MIHVELQLASCAENVPGLELFQQWVDAVESEQDTEVVIRIVDINEMTQLNGQYRHKPGPTNVLSFPADVPAEVNLAWLGDIVICAPVVDTEARQQQKSLNSHWAHLTVHGILHLLGYDHMNDQDAEHMEQQEIAILHTLGFDNPYSC